MTEEINGHQVEEAEDNDSVNFSCKLCGMGSNFKVAFRRENCTA